MDPMNAYLIVCSAAEAPDIIERAMIFGKKVAVVRAENESRLPRVTPIGTPELIAKGDRAWRVDEWAIFTDLTVDLLICTTGSSCYLSDAQVDLVEMYLWSLYMKDGRIYSTQGRGRRARQPSRPPKRLPKRTAAPGQATAKTIEARRPPRATRTVDISKFLVPVKCQDQEPRRR